MRITQPHQLEPLLAPLAEGVGEPVADHEDFDWLDEQMMKVGSLQHGEVDWSGAETRAARLLSETGKDLKVLGHLLHCLQHDGDPARFALSLELLAGALDAWWEAAYPFAGPRGKRARPKLFQQFTQRALSLAGGLEFLGAAEDHAACRAALDRLRERAAGHELPDEALADLSRLLDQATPSAEAPSASGASAAPAGGGEPSRAAAPATEAEPAAPKAPEARLESGNDRGNRQALLKMADFLNEQSPGEALGYRLRRHAVWHAIQGLPMTRDGQRTELAPVSADRVAEYREAAAGRPTPEDWRRIENSLALSPYWLEGHRLSAEVARRLEQPRCAEAIRDETARFVDRLPGIEALTFSDGSAFLDGETQTWLTDVAGPGAPAAMGGGDPWQAGLETARERLAEEGLAPALAVLDEGLAAAASPREGVYWRLASADLLREAGLAALARQHYQALQDSVANLALEGWEPALPARLAAALEA
ncbi:MULTISPECIES: type VI secretion system protein TssA [Halomonas]|uniref:Type VI secretion-associated protein n=1 Tax=Halomonas halophila TaxID=29573 RepID=A0ABQ0U831_9GAMM|nr:MULTISPECIES: type VI secretion system protein TssA [Halomonas]MDR5890379.1 type VI secretion system protein TssA [Halomonas salina]WJY08131.1 type VI secretion system protein TssA [Halomonas halophila]GEK74576.1 type VI secretion-associated protein [Halomonas halophila]